MNGNSRTNWTFSFPKKAPRKALMVTCDNYVKLGSLESTSGNEPVGCLSDGLGKASGLEIVVIIWPRFLEVDMERSISATTF
jgi:hypothetical protein